MAQAIPLSGAARPNAMSLLRHLPNAITLARMLACLPLSLAIVGGEHRAALGLAVVIGLSDVLDGFLARRYGWQSRIGGLLDPVADKLFLVTAFISLGVVGVIPVWLIVVVLLRDVVIVAGAFAYNRFVEPVPAEPSRLGKASTMAQVLLVLSALVHLAGLVVPEQVPQALIGVVALLAVASGTHYVWTWTLRARAIWAQRESTR